MAFDTAAGFPKGMLTDGQGNSSDAFAHTGLAPAAGVTATVSADTPWAYDLTWQGQAGWSLMVGEAWDAGPDPDQGVSFDQGGGTQTVGVEPGGFLEGVFIDGQGNRSYAFALTGLFPTAPVALAAPTNLSATPSTDAQGNPQVNLVWDDNADNETGYAVERSTSPDFSTDLQRSTVPADITSYVDPSNSSVPASVQPGVTYYYRVQATGGAASEYSNMASAILPLTVEFSAHRTGDYAGQAVSQSVQQSGDPTQYVVLTDNTATFDPAGLTPNYELSTAAISGGDYVRDQTGAPVDPDLAKITLKQLPAGAWAGSRSNSSIPRPATRISPTSGSSKTTEPCCTTPIRPAPPRFNWTSQTRPATSLDSRPAT